MKVCFPLSAGRYIKAPVRRRQVTLQQLCSAGNMSSATAAPPNFSWVDPGKLAGMARPSETAHYRFLLENGIQHLVCLCEEKPPAYDTCPKLKLHQIAIVDFTPPSRAQILQFLSIVEEANAKGQGVGVHCMHGLGRTGTMLACYLLKTRKMSAEDAIKEIRRLRPGSIETKEQEKAVLEFQQYIQSHVKPAQPCKQ